MNWIPFLNYDEAEEEFWRKKEKDILNQETILIILFMVVNLRIFVIG